MAGSTTFRCGCKPNAVRLFASRGRLTAARLQKTQQRQRQVRVCDATSRHESQSFVCSEVCKVVWLVQVVTMGIFGLGGPELAVIAGVAVLIFGELRLAVVCLTEMTCCTEVLRNCCKLNNLRRGAVTLILRAMYRAQQASRPWQGGWQSS